MSDPTIPPLPEGAVEVWSDHEQTGRGEPHVMWRDYSTEQMRAFYLQGYAAGVAAERERCAKLCEENQVEVVIRSGKRRLAPFIAETEAQHEGQTYAAAIRKGPQ